MLDYRGIGTLAKIIKHNSFELAAEELCVSQSAISQRVKALQTFYGDPLIIRGETYQPSDLGQILITHYKQVEILETNLENTLNNHLEKPSVSIAISRDSFEIWLFNILQKNYLFDEYVIDVITDDQDYTITYFKKGLASICFSTYKEAVSTCQSVLVGNFTYHLVATPEFVKNYFIHKNHKQNLLSAPSILYDRKDDLHSNYLEKYFNIRNESLNCHIIPSVTAFKKMALQGYAYALITELDILDELGNGTLVKIFPHKPWEMPTYLHWWDFGDLSYKKLIDLLILKCRQILI